MTKKLRNWFIKNKRKKAFDNLYLIWFITTLIVIIVSHWMNSLKPVGLVMFIITIYVFSTIYSVLDAIRKCDDKVIEDNRILYITLSDKRAVGDYIIFFVILPFILILDLFMEFNFLTTFILIFLLSCFLIKSMDVITNHFRKKIKGKSFFI